jgi:glutamate dehydrogenase/leucine dehydrogenase
LTIGFARRFATYKRGTLFLQDRDRIKKLLCDRTRKLQFIIAGKAHPKDTPGKELIRDIVRFSREHDVRHSIVFIEDYDTYVSGLMLAGCDIWLNTPLRPREASGTSGMKAAMKHLDGSPSLEGKVVAIQGVGSVGAYLAEMLFWEGAKLIVSDVYPERAEEMKRKFGASVVSLEEILRTPCDILAPCAMGGILHKETIDLCQCRAIVGCANNQLLQPEDSEHIKKRGILYAPDFVVNAGGVINVQIEMEKLEYSPIRVRAAVEKIYQRLLTLFHMADTNGYTTDFAAMELAKRRLGYNVGV